MSYDGAGSIYALGARFTKLDDDGAPLIGADNAYVTEAMISIGLGQTYSEPDAIEVVNGAGRTCVFYQPNGVLTGGTLEEFAFCQPDPYIFQFLVGGDLIMSGEEAIGYQAPAVNTDPLPNGVAVEVWSRAILDNAFAPGLPYLHWVLPRAKLRPDGSMTLNSEDALQPAFAGTIEQNGEFGDGPVGDITFPTNRLWQYCRVATIPTFTAGLVDVVADSS